MRQKKIKMSKSQTDAVLVNVRLLSFAIYLVIGFLTCIMVVLEFKLSDSAHPFAHPLPELALLTLTVGGGLFAFFSFKSDRHLSLQDERLSAADTYIENVLAELVSHKQGIDAHAMVIKIDLDGDITYVNDRFCKVFNYDKDELIGKNYRTIYSDDYSIPLFKEMYGKVFTGKVWSGEVQNKAKDGSLYWTYATLVPVRNGFGMMTEFISIHTDITQIKETTTALRESNHILHTTFENFPGGIAAFDQNLILQVANSAYYYLRDLPKEQFPPGSRFEDILRYYGERGSFGQGDVEEQIAQLIAMVTGQEVRSFQRKTPEGRTLKVEYWPLETGGFLISQQDITDYEMMLVSLKAKSEQAQKVARELREARDAQVKTHEHLLSSINSMRNGFAIWDKSGHLILANDTYKRFYHEIEHLIVKGLHISDMLKAGCEKKIWDLGTLSAEEWIAKILRKYVEGSEVERDLKLSDGTQLILSCQFLDNGDMISSHIDVTAQRQREEELRKAKDELERIAYYDDLTGLPNRAYCQRDMEKHFSGEGQDRRFAVVLIDLDNFKRVNDTEGHTTGDHLLSALGTRLDLFAQQVPNFKPYRWGGDEFIGLIERDDNTDLEVICQELTDLIAIPVTHNSNTLWPTVSLGVARYPEDAQDLKSLMIFSDLALYKTKELGRDGYQFFSLHMKEKVDEESQIEKDLREAIKNEDQFELHFQPQICSANEKITGVEALIRWNHPTRGLVPPGFFLDIVEHCGLASSVGRIVFDKAMKAARIWMDQGLDFGRLAVNLSPHHIKKNTIIEDFFRSVDKYKVEPDLLSVEFLESFLLDDPHADIASILREMARRGVHVELDDFGTGYASLSHLSTLPIDGFKIDRTFVQDIIDSEKQQAILEVMLAMSKLMKLRVVCEGVETYEQAHALSVMSNCSLQGYYISRPMNFEKMTEWMREKRNFGVLKKPALKTETAFGADQEAEGEIATASTALSAAVG